jgi:hypothetical protein
MKRRFAASLALAFFVCSAVQAAELTDTLVEKTLGASGVKHTSKTQTRQGMTFTDIDYTDGKGQSLITVRLGTVAQYGLWKQGAGSDAKPLSGLGTDAFRYEGLKTVCAKTLTAAACVTPDYLIESPKITDAHLQALVKAAL